MSIATEALNLAAAGWPIFPLVENGKKPRTAHGLKDASNLPLHHVVQALAQLVAA